MGMNPAPFEKLVGIQVQELRDGYAKASLKIGHEHLNSIGLAHGGAIFSLADCVFAEAANFGENVAVAINANIDFLNPSLIGDVLTAEAIRISESKKLGFYHITVFKKDVAIAFFSGIVYRKK